MGTCNGTRTTTEDVLSMSTLLVNQRMPWTLFLRDAWYDYEDDPDFSLASVPNFDGRDHHHPAVYVMANDPKRPLVLFEIPFSNEKWRQEREPVDLLVGVRRVGDLASPKTVRVYLDRILMDKCTFAPGVGTARFSETVPYCLLDSRATVTMRSHTEESECEIRLVVATLRSDFRNEIMRLG